MTVSDFHMNDLAEVLKRLANEAAAREAARARWDGFKAGAVAVLTFGLLIAVLFFATGLLRFVPPEQRGAGPIGDPRDVVPGLPPAGGPAASLSTGPVPLGTTAAPPVKPAPGSFHRPAPPEAGSGLSPAPAPDTSTP